MRVVRTNPDGSTLVFEDQDPEAIGRAIAAYERGVSLPKAVAVVEESVDPWDDFVARVSDKPEQLSVLYRLKSYGPHTINQLADALHVESTRDLGGLLGAIRRSTLRAGFASTDEVISKKGAAYMPGGALIQHDLPLMPSTKTRWERLLENADSEEDI